MKEIVEMKMVDLGAQMEAMGGSNVILSALAGVLHSEAFINGEPIRKLETLLADFAERRFAIACASGTDALMLALWALNVRGGAVVVPAFGFPAALEVAALLGARVALVDVGPDGMIWPPSLTSLLSGAPARPRAIVVMDMFGTPAAYNELVAISEKFGVPLVADAAQSFGSEFVGQKASRFGKMTTTSFFPSKPLGCYGDGGMIFTDDIDLNQKLRLLRNHGMGKVKYNHETVGTNSRLDTLQAAVLLKKFEIFPQELEVRNIAANLFLSLLREEVPALTPLIPPNHVKSSWACLSVRAKSWEERDVFLKRLAAAHIPYAIHYPWSFVDQPAFRHHIIYNDACCATSRALAATIFQLPFHPYLTSQDLEAVITALKA
jgi:dTDP-4-amino-4,6-dideoxygalactose transaminase